MFIVVIPHTTIILQISELSIQFFEKYGIKFTFCVNTGCRQSTVRRTNHRLAYKKVQTICVEAMEIPDTLSMPEFVSLPVPAEPANVPVESAIRSNAVVTMHIGKAKIDIPETTSTEFIKKLIGALAYVE